jgi:hypothetical protein
MLCAFKHHGNLQYIGNVIYVFNDSFITMTLKQRRVYGTACNMNDVSGGGGGGDCDDGNNNNNNINNNNNNHSLILILLVENP